jgi:hypothetical protein
MERVSCFPSCDDDDDDGGGDGDGFDDDANDEFAIGSSFVSLCVCICIMCAFVSATFHTTLNVLSVSIGSHPLCCVRMRICVVVCW